MREFIGHMTPIEWAIVAAIILILAALALSIPGRLKQQREFMAACTQQEPEYQCAYKWKQMHPDSTVVYVRN